MLRFLHRCSEEKLGEMKILHRKSLKNVYVAVPVRMDLESTEMFRYKM